MNEIAESRDEDWLSRYGGKISSEWLFPKLWQILDEDEEIYNVMEHFVEVAYWVIWQLTGVQTSNSCTAGYKAIWHGEAGFPVPDFFAALDERLKNVVADKLSCPITPIGQ